MIKKFSLLGFSTIFIIALISLRNFLPPIIVYAPFDDSLYVGMSKIIYNLDLDNYTAGFDPLVKGVAYPYILAIAKWLSIPSLVLPHLVLILSIAILSFTLFKVSKSHILSLLFLLIVLLDPFPISFFSSKISREMTHQSFLMLSISLILASVFYPKLKFRKLFSFITGALSAVFFTVSFNTREEHIWLYLIFMSLFILIFLNFGMNKYFIITLAAFIVTVYLSNKTIEKFHFTIYEVKQLNSTTQGNFPKLMKNLASIKTQSEEIPFVSITAEKRNEAYKVSPTFKKLESFLEGPGQAWIQHGCNDSETCTEYANGWFHVALRDGIREIGKWENQKQAQRFMKKANIELELACTNQQLTCVAALPIAPALGVIRINDFELPKILSSFNKYIFYSFSGWGGSSPHFGMPPELPEWYWGAYSDMFVGLPDNEIEYREMFFARWSYFINYYNLWSMIYSIGSVIGITLYMIFSFRFFVKEKTLLDRFLFILGTTSFVAWLFRGLLLSVTEATSFSAINSLYATSGRIFFSVVVATGYIQLCFYKNYFVNRRDVLNV